MSGQQLRRSQFILTYGPGAILEGYKLDDPRSYHEDKLTTYAGEQP